MGVIDNMKDIADLIKKAGDLELYRKIVESEGEVIELTRENRRLGEKVNELEKTIAIHKKMVHQPPFHFQEGDPTPFCSPCWETKKLAVHVIFSYDNDEQTRWDCPTCKQMFLIKKNVRHRRTQIAPFDSSDENDWMR
jgi:hypothetical protein